MRWLTRLVIAGILALPLTLGTAHAATDSAQPPYYFRWASNHSWCLVDPGDSVVNGTAALLSHCKTTTPGMQLHFVKIANDTWFIETDRGMCLEDPAHGPPGTALDWWSCEQVTWMYWGWYLDVAGHDFWPDYYTTPVSIELLNANPYEGATIQGGSPPFPPLPRNLADNWCVTDAIGTPLVCD